MKDEFIPYEIALALKELGFNENCLGCYSELNELIIRIPDYRSFKIVSRFNIITKFNTYDNKTISAPLYQQAFRWFRENYNLNGLVNHYSNVKLWGYSVHNLEWSGKELVEYSRKEDRSIKYDTYEKAELECLKKLIEIVKNDKK